MSIVAGIKGCAICLTSLDISFNHFDEATKDAIAMAFKGRSSKLEL